MKGSVLFLLAAVLMLVSPLWAEHDDRIGQIYLNEAASLFDSGKYSETRNLLETSLQFSRENSDLLYLYGRLGLQEGGDLKSVQLYFESALRINEWKLYSTIDAAHWYIPILFQTKQYRQAEKLFSNPDYNPEPSAFFLWMHARSCMELERWGDAVDIIKQGLAFYPQSEILFEILFQIDSEERGRYIDLLGNGSMNRPGMQEMLLPLLFKYTEDEVVLNRLFSIYDRIGIYNIHAELLKIKMFGLNDLADLDKLVDNGLFEVGEYSRVLYTYLPFSFQRQRVDELFRDFSGEITEDINNDGWPEIRLGIESGRVIRIDYDPDQDGIINYRAEYNAGISSSISVSGDTDLFIEYEVYPWVKRITTREEERVLVYNIALGNHSLTIPEINPFIESPQIEIPSLNWSVIQSRSRNVLVYNPGSDSPLEEYIPLFDNGGKTVRNASESEDFNRTYYIREGRLYMEEQDLVGSKEWDTIRYYNNGILRLIAHDAREDGIFEYAETVGDDSWSYWDFNQNGKYDCRQSRNGESILREYSSADNGMYDILIEIEGDL